MNTDNLQSPDGRHEERINEKSNMIPDDIRKKIDNHVENSGYAYSTPRAEAIRKAAEYGYSLSQQPGGKVYELRDVYAQFVELKIKSNAHNNARFFQFLDNQGYKLIKLNGGEGDEK